MWYKCEEKHPEIGQRCLVCSIHGEIESGTFSGDGWAEICGDIYAPLSTVSYWMPMPKPPKKG